MPPIGLVIKLDMLRMIKLKTKVNFSTYKIEKDTDFVLYT